MTQTPSAALHTRFLLVLLSLAALLPPAQAQTNSSAHLLLIDTSIAISRKRGDVTALVRRAIESGFAGTIAEGEKYSVWTFNQQTSARQFPDQAWSLRDATLQADLIARFLSTQKHAGKAQFRIALQDSIQFLQREGNARVFLITDQNATFAGEPIPDLAQFEDFLQQHLRETKKPALTTVNAHNGQIWNWSIDHNSGPFYVPGLPQPEPPAPPEPAIATAQEEAKPQRVAPPKMDPPLLAPPVLTISERLTSNVRIVPPATTGPTNPSPTAAELFSRVTTNPAPMPRPAVPTRAPAPSVGETPKPLAEMPKAVDEPRRNAEPPVKLPSTAPPRVAASVTPQSAPAPRTNAPAQPKPSVVAQPSPEQATNELRPALAVKPITPDGPASQGRTRLLAGIFSALALFVVVVTFWARRRRPVASGSLISRSLTPKDR